MFAVEKLPQKEMHLLRKYFNEKYTCYYVQIYIHKKICKRNHVRSIINNGKTTKPSI